MPRHPLFKPYLALGAVCMLWGTTYLGIRMALESFPPLVLVSTRYILSGSIMLLFARARGIYLPRGRELLVACASGVVVLGIGNSCLVFSEVFIPSGLAGLITTISPFWLAGVEAMMPRGERLNGRAIAGMLVGLGGAALLFAPGVDTRVIDRSILLRGFLLLQLGMAAWSFGSIVQRRQAGKEAHPVIGGAVQQLAAGVVLSPFALAIPQHPVHWSARGIGALVYLVCFGSIAGYSAFAYALDRLPVAVVSIYSYVNAMVAVALGWLVYREPFGRREALAMAIIFAGVTVVKRYARYRTAKV
ncbi:MAG TPA: EamA family transporter [Bryobacteraceae bacterium]|nr:EamA family transporter [Bryobacteraceae bacterium]